MRLWRLVPLLLALAVVAPSCGGDGSVSDTSTTSLTRPETSTSSSTTTTAAGTDDTDGIANGLYAGAVRLAGDAATPVYDVLDSSVALDVTDDEIRANIELTTRVSIRVTGEEPVCTATISRRYHGRSSPANPLDILMELRGQEILLFEGPQCGVVEGLFDTTAEQTLAIEFAEDRPYPMVGSFRDGRFEGTILEVLAVTAAIGG
jgi:hypothetical protein